jgi:dTDP-4-dehydrorhamnose 3,5-epimerase
MNIININEPFLFTNINSYSDNRGYFYESYKKNKNNLILSQDFLQENHSVSKLNVIRGLHYQWNSPMGKLVKVTKGRIVDVIVDIRKNSNTYKKIYYYDISEYNLNQLWVPAGFAHGFVSLEENTHVDYMCTSVYNKFGEAGINPFDKNLDINWYIKKEDAICSEKDLNAQSFEDYLRDPKF